VTQRTRILFLCSGNSCRSQMAEGLARELSKGTLDVSSAGHDPQPVSPMAVRVMAAAGVDISTQQSKPMEQFVGDGFDFVITLCDRAREACPQWPNVKEQIHWSIDDPAEATGTEDERLRAFSRARDDIRTRLQLFMLANRIGGREGALL
jgi:thioredoxin type arsenate reductase